MLFIPKPTGAYKRFAAKKRDYAGNVVTLGIVSAVNKTQADTKARFIFGKFLAAGEAVWAEEEELVA